MTLACFVSMSEALPSVSEALSAAPPPEVSIPEPARSTVPAVEVVGVDESPEENQKKYLSVCRKFARQKKHHRGLSARFQTLSKALNGHLSSRESTLRTAIQHIQMQRHKIATHALWSQLPPAHRPNTVPVSFMHFENEEGETADKVKVDDTAANEQSDEAEEQEPDEAL